jgi:hypothetical protein
MTEELPMDPGAIRAALYAGPSTDPLPTATAAKLRADVETRCRDLSVHLIETPIDFDAADGQFDDQVREIRVPPLTTELAYLVALHELGHGVLGLPSDEVRDGVRHRLYTNEGLVWAWAIENALDPPTDDAVAKIVTMLSPHDPGEGRSEAKARVRAAAAARRTAPRP